jgi:hypothetical protein
MYKVFSGFKDQHYPMFRSSIFLLDSFKEMLDSPSIDSITKQYLMGSECAWDFKPRQKTFRKQGELQTPSYHSYT